ncbi:hypothetical protein ABB37_03927 [Leptomonas pyrrhocoris]|uniref:Uncharacterized protein n=1 Tax=Leptomonas pyrrhocoris TaxID=157538 RepID=A0A0N0DWC4_LEPPY|nr:hypothetical protein ABB37_03927 [Leptomonas pyrrhocoris]KPA81591.1 hypothetical protein ABB37_03927 [Leptomonas pyrrhocoris]|eukprot:XP_015660030.1 hypothetical protein ABB37_03927 [Leptomonas pyrrhocoris]
MYTHIAVAAAQGVTNVPLTSTFLSSAPAIGRAQVSLPAVFSTPIATHASDQLSRDALGDGAPLVEDGVSTPARDVSWQEYQRVCANEATLRENVETLKALALQLAVQLNRSQEEVQLLTRSSSTLQLPRKAVQDSAADPETTAGDAMTRNAKEKKAVVEAETAKQELFDVVAHKDRIINALQQRLATQETRFCTLIDDLVREKDATIERLAVELDLAKRLTN